MSGVCEVHWFAELFGPHSSWDSCTWGPNHTIFLMSLPLPHTETHWQDFSPPLRGFSWVPILRVVRKAMPLLWGATCSRHLPQDLNERRCCRHVTGPHTRHTHTHTHHNCQPKFTWFCLINKHILTLCNGTRTFVVSKKIRLTSKSGIEFLLSNYQGEARVTNVWKRGQWYQCLCGCVA